MSKGAKRFTAPLAFCNAELVEDDEKPNFVTMEIIWDSVTLNYDLLTLMLGQILDDEGDAAAPPQVGVENSTANFANPSLSIGWQISLNNLSNNMEEQNASNFLTKFRPAENLGFQAVDRSV